MRVKNIKDLGRVASISALAFGRSRWKAALMWLAFFALASSQLSKGEVHLTNDRNGTFTLTRRGSVAALRQLLATVIFIVAVLALAYVLLSYAPPVFLAISVVAVIAAVWFLVGAAVMIASQERGTSVRDVGRETPKGTRWSVSSLAQRPGTYWSAVHAATDRIAALPSGSIVVAVAGSDALERLYVERGGFSKGKDRRVHRVIP